MSLFFLHEKRAKIVSSFIIHKSRLGAVMSDFGPPFALDVGERSVRHHTEANQEDVGALMFFFFFLKKKQK